MIHHIPIDERPRERCLKQGPECLSLRECLALLLGSGNRGQSCLDLAQNILLRPGPGLAPAESERAFFKAMEVSPQAYLSEIPGIGPARQARLIAAFELGQRYASYRAQGKRLRDPLTLNERNYSNLEDKIGALIPEAFRSESQEWLGFIPVHSQETGHFCLVERGVRTHVNVDPAELFARVLALRPTGFYLFHNHPSGDLTPSEPDIDLTERVKRLASQLGIRLYGHGIVTASDLAWIPLFRRERALDTRPLLS